MSAVPGCWRRAWFAPVAIGDLAVCRIVWSLVGLWHLASSGMAARIAQADAVRARAGEVPLLSLLALPFGGPEALGRTELSAILVVTLAAGSCAAAGAWTRSSLLVFALGSLTLQAWTYSVAALRHDVALLQWALLLLSLTPCGDALGVDAWRARAAGRARGRAGETAPDAAWVLRLGQALLALAYLSAGASKVLRDPVAWFGGWTLQYDVALQALRTGDAAGRWLAGQHAACVAAAWTVAAIEIGFAFSVLARRTVWPWGLAAIAMHAGAAIFMGVWFPSFPALCAALIPWSALAARARPAPLDAVPALPDAGFRPAPPAARATDAHPAPRTS